MEKIKRKIEIHLETTSECIDNFNLDSSTVELLNQDNLLLKEVLEYFKKEVEISDKEIEDAGNVYNLLIEQYPSVYFSKGAKWMRDKQGIAPNKEVEIQFIIDGAYLSKPYNIIDLLNIDEAKVLEDMEVCDCRLTESNNHCEGDCLKYDNSKITGYKTIIKEGETK